MVFLRYLLAPHFENDLPSLVARVATDQTPHERHDMETLRDASSGRECHDNLAEHGQHSPWCSDGHANQRRLAFCNFRSIPFRSIL
jgi:hypothetical protein